jgi:hypothetical protein
VHLVHVVEALNQEGEHLVCELVAVVLELRANPVDQVAQAHRGIRIDSFEHLDHRLQTVNQLEMNFLTASIPLASQPYMIQEI